MPSSRGHAISLESVRGLCISEAASDQVETLFITESGNPNSSRLTPRIHYWLVYDVGDWRVKRWKYLKSLISFVNLVDIGPTW